MDIQKDGGPSVSVVTDEGFPPVGDTDPEKEETGEEERPGCCFSKCLLFFAAWCFVSGTLLLHGWLWCCVAFNAAVGVYVYIALAGGIRRARERGDVPWYGGWWMWW